MKLTASVILLILVILAGPFLVVWAVNTIAEQSSQSFYLHHNIYTYLAVLVIGCVFSGGSSK